LDSEGDGAISKFYIKEFIQEYPPFFIPCHDFKNEINDEGKSLDFELVKIDSFKIFTKIQPIAK
jgi:hypothetical protein